VDNKLILKFETQYEIIFPKGFKAGRENTVGIGTCYGLDGPEIESPCRAIFPAPVQTSLLRNGYGVFPWGKAAGVWR